MFALRPYFSMRQHHAAGIEQRKKVDVNIGLHPLTYVVGDAALAELLSGKFATVAIASDLVTMIAFEHGYEFGNDVFGRQRRLNLANASDDREGARP
jgi:hypothetical protein